MARLLIVEDNENLRDLYQQELSDEGYTVTVADCGAEAVRCVESDAPDLIVMDIAMPGKNGIETMQEIFAKRRVIPIILNTAYPHYRDRFETFQANACINKSGDLTELKEKIQELLSVFGVGAKAVS